jgi:hypothetical protein
MIIITKEEALKIRQKFEGENCITITNRHKKGGRMKYYMAEDPKYVGYLNFIRRIAEKKRSTAKRGV